MIYVSLFFISGGVECLGILEFVMLDGLYGVCYEYGCDWVKDEGVRDSSIYLFVGIVLVVIWNFELGYVFGIVLGKEVCYC